MSKTLKDRKEAQGVALRALVGGLDAFPELRVGQLIWNAVEAADKADVFNVENDVLAENIDAFVRKWS